MVCASENVYVYYTIRIYINTRIIIVYVQAETETGT